MPPSAAFFVFSFYFYHYTHLIMIRFLVVFLYIIPLVATSQNMTRVRTTITTLCAPEMHGRGASFEGHAIAANFLQKRFKEIGLAPLGDAYFQPFTYTINTFPAAIDLVVDGKRLSAGTAYIVQAASPSVNSELKVLQLDTLLFSSTKKQRKLLAKKMKGYAVVYDEATGKRLKKDFAALYKKLQTAGCLIELKPKKLTMGLADEQSAVATFEVLKDSFPINAKKLNVRLDATLIENLRSQNVCGKIEGTSKKDSFLLISAHYDHLGHLGKEQYFPGANDNGSGVSMLLELAEYYATNPLPYTLVFIAFGAEEAGLIGSRYFTENPLIPLRSIKFMVNLDLMGTGDDGMMVVNGSVFEKEYKLLVDINESKKYLPAVKKRGKAANSDHYFFTEKGVPAFFFYTLGGVAAYHDVQDISITLPLTRYKEVFGLITDFLGAMK
jgi:aminopeptidase YwaD